MQILANPMTPEFLINLVSMTFGILLDHFSNFTEFSARFAVLNGHKHGLAGDICQSLDLRIDLSFVILKENHGRIVSMKPVLEANDIYV